MTDEIRTHEIRTHEIRTDEIGTNEIQDETLRKVVKALPRDVAPDHDLWPAIAARIAPRRHWSQSWPAAAAVSGLIVIGAILAVIALHHRTAPTTIAIQQPPTRSQSSTTTPVPNARAEAFAATIRRSTRRDPLAQAVLLKNLGITETSIADIQQALHENPDTPGLQPLLYQQYRNEATLVTAAQRVQLQTATGAIAP